MTDRQRALAAGFDLHLGEPVEPPARRRPDSALVS
jgi:hypothetical protein